ncbi:MAG: helix-turn-helix transcriptional regulator [Candidatus Poribacteria bacterium]|nr:helix-turn-helix transcriptional regulator [Candidatus Poribacteria bacterium]
MVMLVGLRLRELAREKSAREGKRVTQRQIADALGVSQQNVSTLMRGKNVTVRVEHLRRLMAYFECELEALFEVRG